MQPLPAAPRGAEVVAFRRLLQCVVAVELCERARLAEGSPLQVGLAAIALLCALAAFHSRAAAIAMAGSLAVVAIDLAVQLPGAANHHYLQVLLLVLLIVLRVGVEQEGALLLAILRALLVVGLFHAGMQKLLHGYYFQGELLAFALPQNPRFAAILQLLMPEAELSRLQAITLGEGAGPFRVDSVAFLVASNLAYAAELVLPAALLVPRLRRLAVLGVLAYLAAIESAAREVFFGAIMVGLALLWWPGGALRAALPALLAVLVYLLSMSLGLLPRWFFT